MNYRHIYHAGNFADVVKHITLIMLLQKLKEKEKPFMVLDAFAGLGLYDLSSEQSQKTGESEAGVAKLLQGYASQPNRHVTEYLKAIEGFRNSYPGSPIIIASLLRENDRLIAAELHPSDYAYLRHNLRGIKNAHVHHMDAYNAIKAFCPPQEKRGLVLIDPPFEERNEFEKVIESMKLIKKRFTGGITMIWYPIKDSRVVAKFYEDYKQIGFAESLLIEFEMKQREGMNKCGIIIACPPYIKAELEEVLACVAGLLEAKFSVIVI